MQYVHTGNRTLSHKSQTSGLHASICHQRCTWEPEYKIRWLLSDCTLVWMLMSEGFLCTIFHLAFFFSFQMLCVLLCKSFKWLMSFTFTMDRTNFVFLFHSCPNGSPNTGGEIFSSLHHSSLTHSVKWKPPPFCQPFNAPLRRGLELLLDLRCRRQSTSCPAALLQ